MLCMPFIKRLVTDVTNKHCYVSEKLTLIGVTGQIKPVLGCSPMTILFYD